MNMRSKHLKRVLLVNGDLLTRETVALTLPQAEYIVVRAQDTGIALEILRQSNKPVIIIVDFSVTNWQASARFMEVCAAESGLALRNMYILLLTTNETLPLTIGQAITAIQPIIVAKPLSREQLLGAVKAAARLLPSP
jgi:CheY-like chemotaxis protein